VSVFVVLCFDMFVDVLYVYLYVVCVVCVVRCVNILRYHIVIETLLVL